MGDGKVTSGISNLWGGVVKSVTGKLADTGEAAKDAVDTVGKAVTDSGAAELASRGTERLGAYVDATAEAVTDTFKASAQLVDSTVEKGADALEQFKDTAVEQGSKLVDQFLDAAIETGSELATKAGEALVEGVNETLPITINDMATIGSNVVDFIKTGKLTPEQEFVLSKLKPDTSFALSKLSLDDVGKFLKVAGAALFGDGAKTLKAEAGLMLLLVRGDLTKEPPGGGPRLLDVLADRAFKPADPKLAERGIQMGEVLSDVIEVAAMPMIVKQGKGSSTCVAGSLQAAKAAEDPAAYAEFVLSLVQDGKATVKGPDGKPQEMALNTGDIDDGHKGQDMLDAAVQGSMVAFARQAVPDSAGADGDFGGGRTGGGGKLGGGRVGGGGKFGGGRLGGSGKYGGGRVGGGGKLGGDADEGLTLRQADHLYEVTLGRKGQSVNVEDGNAALITAKIEAAAGKHPVQVGLQAVQPDGSIGGHMVAVQGATTSDDGKPLLMISDSNTGEITAMPRDEFQKLLVGAILPEQTTGGPR